MNLRRYFFWGILLLSSVMTVYCDFKDSEMEVALEVLEKLKVYHCVLLVDNPQSVILNSRKIYNSDIFISYTRNKYLRNIFNTLQSFYFKIGFVMKLNAIDILQDLFEKEPVNVAKFTWLIFANENVGYKFIIPYNCDFLTVQSGGENKFFVKEIYYVKYSGPYVVDFGAWSATFGLVPNNKFTKERKDMRGVTFIRGDNNGFNICNNFTIEIKQREMWLEYSRMLNFSLEIVNDMLYNDSTDPLQPDGSPCAVAQHALNYFPDMVHPTFLMDLYIVIKFENDFGEGWKSYFKPFEKDVWYSILSFLILSTTSFVIIGHFTKSNPYTNPFIAIYSLCFQGGVDIDSGKNIKLSFSIAYLMPYIAATVVVPAYSAAILAKLTVQLPKVPFTDLETFSQDGTYKLGALNNTFVIKYFTRSDNPFISKMYHEMFIKETEYPNVYEDAADKLCTDEKFAFVPYEPDLLEGKSICKLFKIPKSIFYLNCGFRMRPGSPFRQIFKQLLIQFHTSGTLNRVNKTNLIQRRIIPDELFTSITISHVFPILNLIPFGIFISLSCLQIEIFF